MLNNNKCILVYGLSQEELIAIRELGQEIIEIRPDMCEMTITDIITGLDLPIFNTNPKNEKVILYNNFPEIELKNIIKDTRAIVQGGILAIVTPTSTKWKVNYLIEHLVEEREWHAKRRGW